MAMHHFWLKEPVEGKVGMSSYLRFDGRTVSVEWKYGETVSMFATIGDMVYVDCWGGLPRIGKTVPPKRLNRLAYWLIGLPKDARFPTREAAELEFDGYVEHNLVDGWGSDSLECRRRTGERWFAGQKRSAYTDFRWQHFCGWVSSDISLDEVREMVEHLGSRWSREYTEKVLAEAGA